VRVSVVIPCFNSLRYLPETLDSVLDQQLPEGVDGYEVVLVDDGGEDDLTSWASARGDERVRVVRQENAGVSAARNRGIAESSGELVAFCDSDDLWTPTTVAALVGCFVRTPHIGLAHGWYDVIDADGRPTGRVNRSELEGHVWERLVLDNPIAASGVMVRREVFDALGGFAVNRDRFRIDVEDWELWIRIAGSWPLGLAREVVAHHRRHDANSSADVESIEAAYQHLLAVVFDDATDARRRLRPLAEARMEVRLASHWINDRREPAAGLAHLRRAALLDPRIRRTREHLQLHATARALRLGGERGYAAMKAANQGARRALRRLRNRSGSGLSST
jgi:glycosyltransferase involved in cell wall biosynthesis